MTPKPEDVQQRRRTISNFLERLFEAGDTRGPSHSPLGRTPGAAERRKKTKAQKAARRRNRRG